MLLAGFLSTMNVWADKLSDIRLFHLNDIYMILLMTGWMFLFMGIYYTNMLQLVLGLIMVVVMLVAIRYQLFIGQEQYLKGMIPHHSMAVLMSKELLRKNSGSNAAGGKVVLDDEILGLAKSIINGQEKEIGLMTKYV